jgi:prepilin-type N-terminal cleavage/methylation domain-containing protein
MGFTLIELLMVVAVMAILSTLAIVAVLNSGKQPQQASYKTACVALQAGLMNYRAAEQQWPVTLSPQEGTQVVFHENNALVFAPLFKNPKKPYLDISALLTKVQGQGVLPLRKALEKGIALEQCPLGAPYPTDKEAFRYFKVTFDLSLDTVKVE